MKTVKELIEHGATIKLPYKKELLDWYSEIALLKDDDIYVVMVPYARPVFNDFKTFEKAYEYFLSFKYNIGILQMMILKENPELDDVEYQEEEYKKAIEKKKEELGIK
jgi:hypothetical protein